MMASSQRQSPSASAALAAAAARTAASPLNMLRPPRSIGAGDPKSSRTLTGSLRRSSQSSSQGAPARRHSASLTTGSKIPFPLPGSDFGDPENTKRLREVTIGEEFSYCPSWDAVGADEEFRRDASADLGKYYEGGRNHTSWTPEERFSSERMRRTLAISETYLEELKADIAAGIVIPTSDTASRQLRSYMAVLANTVEQLKTLTTEQPIADSDVKGWDKRFRAYKSIFDLSRRLTTTLQSLKACVDQSCQRSRTVSRRPSRAHSSIAGVSER